MFYSGILIVLLFHVNFISISNSPWYALWYKFYFIFLDVLTSVPQYNFLLWFCMHFHYIPNSHNYMDLFLDFSYSSSGLLIQIWEPNYFNDWPVIFYLTLLVSPHLAFYSSEFFSVLIAYLFFHINISHLVLQILYILFSLMLNILSFLLL